MISFIFRVVACFATLQATCDDSLILGRFSGEQYTIRLANISHILWIRVTVEDDNTPRPGSLTDKTDDASTITSFFIHHVFQVCKTCFGMEDCRTYGHTIVFA